MEVFNKIRSTLTSTVSEIAAALPGNPLLREYDAGKQVASAGPDYLWKIYDGTKKSTKAAVSIFVLEKRQLDRYPKGSRDMILEVLRKGAAQLTKLRHPRVLTVEHAMDESRESIVFCTEPVFASLGNVLGEKQNISENDMPTELRSYHLFDVEIKYGILQISEGLAFLHESVKMLHGNLCPESIIINKQGVWKLGGFDFCLNNTNPTGEAKFASRDWDTTLPVPAQPNCHYVAPEIITEKRCDFGSDLFSLGALLYSIYNDGKTLLQCSHSDIYRTMPRSVDKLRNISAPQLSKIPSEVLEHERMLIHPDSTVRPDAEQMSKLPYFEDIGVVTLQYLDNILQRDNLQKSQFFKGLAQVLPKLPKRVILQRVLPSLTAEFANHDMVPFVLPNVLKIVEECDDQQYKTLVFPSLIPVFKVQSPVQVLLILLQNMDLLLKKTEKEMVQAHLLPMICNALGAPSLQIQELCLSIIPTFAQRLDLSSMKNSIVPRIKKIILEGQTVSVRINGLVCLGKLLSTFDKWFVMNDIFPILFQVQSREPGILMAVLGIFQTSFSHKKLGISKDVLATKVLPFLLPICVESNLNLQQFTTFMSVVKEMLQRVETDQRCKLEQLSQMKVDDSIASFNKLAAKDNPSEKSKSATADVDDIFGKGSATSQKESASNGDGPTVTRQHLTLEEKQRLARAKEQEYRMKQQGEIKPVLSNKANNARTAAKPKDLTSTLMQNSAMKMGSSNMTNGASGANRNTPSYYGGTMQTPTSNVRGPMQPLNPPMQNMMQSYRGSTMTAANQRPMGMAQPATQTIGSMQGWNSNASVTGTGGFNQKSSLDNLLNMQSQARPVPMQSMQRPNRPTHPQQYGTSTMPMMQPQRPMPSQGTNNAFAMANPFSTAPTSTPTPQQQLQPQANLSKQDLLDFLG